MRWSVTYVLLSLSVPDVLLWVRALHIILPALHMLVQTPCGQTQGLSVRDQQQRSFPSMTPRGSVLSVALYFIHSCVAGNQRL